MEKNYLKFLKARGLMELVNDEERIMRFFEEGPIDAQGKRKAIYCGFDPTAHSLTVGHLVPLLNLRRAQDFGFTPIILFGGATALIGDPTGRLDMRPMRTAQEIQESIENFGKLIQKYFRWDVENKPIVVNNYDWIGKMSWLDFGCKVGVHFTVARLLSSEVNRTRYEAGGLTFMELGYQLIQSYDFVHLAREYNCLCQCGGNDQWGNILAGADLNRRLDSREAFCFTNALITDSQGKKLGKSTGNAVWIDPQLTSAFDLYQYVRNIQDDFVHTFFRFFTFLPLEEINEIMKQDIILAKERLGFEMVSLIHNEGEAQKAIQASKALFAGGGDWASTPQSFIKKEELSHMDILTLLVQIGLCGSKGEARRLVSQNGLMMNGEKCPNPSLILEKEYFNHECGGMLLRKGQKHFYIIKIED